MNFIESNLIGSNVEGRVEWRGNGVIVIRERSVALSVWRLFLHVERQLYFSIRWVVGVFKNRSAQQKLKIKSLMMVKKKAWVINQPDKVVSLKTARIKKYQAKTNSQQTVRQAVRPKVRQTGTLTEIRRYAETDSVAVNAGDEQSALQQLLPALAGFCEDRWLVLVSPPQRPDTEALIAAGINPSRVMLVHAGDSRGSIEKENKTGLTIIEQALQSGTCGAVVAWLEECDTSTLQRLRNAAVTGQAWGVMFRETGKETMQLKR